MSLPTLDVAAARHYCEQRVPPHAIDDVRVELEESRGAITIVELRPPWREDFGPEWTSLAIARFRWSKSAGVWTLYWRDQDERWHRYEPIGSTSSIGPLLDEVDRDPTGIFWG